MKFHCASCHGLIKLVSFDVDFLACIQIKLQLHESIPVPLQPSHHARFIIITTTPRVTISEIRLGPFDAPSSTPRDPNHRRPYPRGRMSNQVGIAFDQQPRWIGRPDQMGCYGRLTGDGNRGGEVEVGESFLPQAPSGNSNKRGRRNGDSPGSQIVSMMEKAHRGGGTYLCADPALDAPSATTMQIDIDMACKPGSVFLLEPCQEIQRRALGLDAMQAHVDAQFDGEVHLKFEDGQLVGHGRSERREVLATLGWWLEWFGGAVVVAASVVVLLILGDFLLCRDGEIRLGLCNGGLTQGID